MKFYQYLLGSFFILTSLLSQAQSDNKISGYYFVPSSYNPAYAGSFEIYSISAVYNSQWVGFEGAPKTFQLSGHTRLDLSKTGLGFDVAKEEAGAIAETKLNINYAYHLSISKKLKLALGLKGGISNAVIDYNVLAIEHPEEFNGGPSKERILNPLIGTGLYLHTENAYVGLSVPNLITSKSFNNYKMSSVNSTPNYYFNLGYKWNIDEDFVAQPSVVSRFAKGASSSHLFSMLVDWKEKVYGSVHLEPNVSVGAFAGFRISESLIIGYSYDKSVNTFSNYNQGSHAIYVNFRKKEIRRQERFSYFTF